MPCLWGHACAAEFESLAASRGYPLRFSSLDEEVGFWGLLALLNFGSGFRVPLQAARQRVSPTLRLFWSSYEHSIF